MRRISALWLLALCGGSAADGESSARHRNGGRQASYLRATDPSQQRHPAEDRQLQYFSEAPTAATAQGACSLNSNGFYGDAIGSVYELQFSYQALLTEDATQENLVEDVAPALDVGIPEAILPAFFSECGARRRGLQMVEPTIEGVSRLQTDYVITNGNFCVGGSTDRNCYVFSGSINVFGQNFYTQSDVENVVLPAIQQAIQSGQLLPLSPYLEKITYLDDGMQTAAPVPTYAPRPTVPTPSSASPTASPAPGSSFPTPSGFPTPSTGSLSPTLSAPPSPGTAAPTQPSEPRGASRVPWWGWLLVAIGAVGLILCVYLALAEDDRGRPKPSSSDAPDKDGDTGSYEPPGDDAYVPPPDGYGADTMDTTAFRLGAPSGNLGVVQESGENADEFQNDEVDEETYEEETFEEGEGDEEEGEDDEDYEEGEEGEDGDEYEDGEEYEEGDEDYEEGEGDEEGDEEYDDEEGEGDEDDDEEEYYEEETMETPGTDEDNQRWR